MQRTVLADIVDRILESTWLAALVAVPALMNVYSERVFEGDKVPFLRSLALLAVALCGVRCIERVGRGALRRQPLVAAAVAVVLVTLLANVFSIAPTISLWGSYDRLQGTSTVLAYATFFFVFVAVGGRAQVDRLVTAALIATLVPSLYALVQALGIDPIAWGPGVVGRVPSTAGNAIFLGAFLILVVPLSLARLLGAVESKRAGAGAVHLTLLVLQVVALALTQSRGPILALALGLVVFILGAVPGGGARRALGAAGTIAIVVILAAVCVRTLALPLREDAAVAMDFGTANARVRLLIWESTASLIAAEPARLVSGYGPDTFRFVFPPFFPPELLRLEEAGVTADRAHNDILDTIVSTGLLGLSARLCFIVALLAALARAVSRRPKKFNSDDFLPLGLLAAVSAHLAEIQVSISTVSTEFYFWMYAAVGAVLLADSRRQNETVNDDDAAAILGFAVASLLAIVIFSLYTSASDSSTLQVLGAFVGLTWFGALAIVVASGSGARLRLVGVARFAVASLGGGLAFALPYALWIRWRPVRGGAVVASDYITQFVSVLYIAVFVLVLFGGVVAVLLSDRRSMRFSARPWLQTVVVPVILVTTVWLVAVTNLAASRADIYAEQGLNYEKTLEFKTAAQVYERALRLQPWESRYALLRARALTEGTTGLAGHEAFAGSGEVEHAALAAWEINPLEADNASLVARVNRRLSAAFGGDRARYNDTAGAFYQQALRLSPRHSMLWNEYAGFLLEIDEPAKALAAIDEAVSLDQLRAANHLLRAHASMRLELYEDALAAADRAVTVDPELLPAWTAKALALTRLGRPEEAIDANLRALELAPRDLIIQRNLAALYRDQGEPDAALRHAHAALEMARGEERQPLEQLVSQLEALRANHAPAK